MAGKCYMNDAKREPIKKFYREIGEEYTDYVGIAADEPERLEKNEAKERREGIKSGFTIGKVRIYGRNGNAKMPRIRSSFPDL